MKKDKIVQLLEQLEKIDSDIGYVKVYKRAVKEKDLDKFFEYAEDRVEIWERIIKEDKEKYKLSEHIVIRAKELKISEGELYRSLFNPITIDIRGRKAIKEEFYKSFKNR